MYEVDYILHAGDCVPSKSISVFSDRNSIAGSNNLEMNGTPKSIPSIPAEGN